MVYDEKLDLTQAGYMPGPDGRQGYRKKIDEVIRFRLLLDKRTTISGYSKDHRTEAPRKVSIKKQPSEVYV